MEKEAEPLDLDLEALDESPSVVKLEKATNWEHLYSQYLVRASAYTDDLAHPLAMACANAHIRNLSSELAHIRSFDNPGHLPRIQALISSLDLAHARINTRAHTSSRNLARDLNLARASDFVNTKDLAYHRDFAYDLAHVCVNASVSAFARAFSGKRDLTYTSMDNLARTLARASILATASSTAQGSPDLFALARLLALLSICVSFSGYEIATLQTVSVSPFWGDPSMLVGEKKHKQLVLKLQQTLNGGIEIDRRLEQLEQRKKGEQPAYEGILLVRERRHIAEV